MLTRLGWLTCLSFLDGARPSDLTTGLAAVRDIDIGPFAHWYLGIAELYLREPRADAFLLIRANRDLPMVSRTELESFLWPAPNAGLICIRAGDSNQSEYGLSLFQNLSDLEDLQGWCFPGFAIRSLLSSRQVISHRLRGMDAGRGMLHIALYDWIKSEKVSAYVLNRRRTRL